MVRKTRMRSKRKTVKHGGNFFTDWRANKAAERLKSQERQARIDAYDEQEAKAKAALLEDTQARVVQTSKKAVEPQGFNWAAEAAEIAAAEAAAIEQARLAELEWRNKERVETIKDVLSLDRDQLIT